MEQKKPLLYVITPVLRLDNLTKIGENLKTVCEHLDVRWLPVFDSFKGNDACEKRNAALDMINQEGWVYHLDDDNIFHPTFAPALLAAIEKHPDIKIFLFKQVRANGTTYLHCPNVAPCQIDTGSYVVHTSAAKESKWSIKELPCPDFCWIARVHRKYKFARAEGLCYYNGLR